MIIPIASLLAALVADALQADRPGSKRTTPETWEALWRRSRTMSPGEVTEWFEQWRDHLPEGWTTQISEIVTLQPAAWEGDGWWEDVVDHPEGLFHVTARVEPLMKSGQLLARRQVGGGGLGGGYYNAAPDMVSVTPSFQRARRLQKVLSLAVSAANDEIAPSDLARQLWDLYGPPLRAEPGSDVDRHRAALALFVKTNPFVSREVYDALYDELGDLGIDHDQATKALLEVSLFDDDALQAEGIDPEAQLADLDELLASPALRERQAIELFVDNVEGNSWVPMGEIVAGDFEAVDRELAGHVNLQAKRRDLQVDAGSVAHLRGELLYEMVNRIDRDAGDLVDLPGVPHLTVGLTLPFTTFVGLRASDVHIVPVAVRRSAFPQDLVEEWELRFYPDDVTIAPVVFGGTR